MSFKKKKELYHANAIVNFGDPENLIFFFHLTSHQHSLLLRKKLEYLSEMKCLKKQILFKFLNHTKIGFPKQLNGKLFVFCEKDKNMNITSSNHVFSKEISLLGAHWDNFYFSDFILKSIKRWNDIVCADNLMELQAKTKMYFFQKMSDHFIITNLLAKSLFFFEQTIYLKIFLCRA